MKRLLLSLFFLTMLLSTTAQASTQFADVPANSWAINAIENAVNNGLMSGTGDGNFGYGNHISRAEYVALLNNMFNWNAANPSSPTFTDVTPGQWYYTHIESAAANHIISPMDWHLFNPTEPILRQDMAVMLVRALGYSSLAQLVVEFEPMPFTDVSNYKGYIIVAHDIGLISGVGGGLFAPYNTATREQAAAMITHIYSRLNAPLHWIHGFYAFASFHQRDLIRDMHAISFGWSQMEWNEETGARLNTTAQNNNPWVIPSGYELIANFPRENNATTNLSVFMDTTMGLDNLIASESSRRQAIDAILQEATRIYEAIGRSPFDGVTINFEGLRGETAKNNFSAFLVALEYRLRAANLSLYVTVHPQTIDGIYFDGYDIRLIGELADRVILMAHDYHPRSMDGFIGTHWHRNAAITPIAEVYRALKAITHPTTGVSDHSKIAIAFNFANIGWFVDEQEMLAAISPVAVAPEVVITRKRQTDTRHGWSETFRNPYMVYTTEDGERVFLWFENDRSVEEKLNLARLFGITGASVWRIGIVPNEFDWDVWGAFTRR